MLDGKIASAHDMRYSSLFYCNVLLTIFISHLLVFNFLQLLTLTTLLLKHNLEQFQSFTLYHVSVFAFLILVACQSFRVGPVFLGLI